MSISGIKYRCTTCGNYQSDLKKEQFFICNHCPPGKGHISAENVSAVIGTRDGFGIGKEFVDPESNKMIDTWPKWEKAGYKPLKDAVPTQRRRRCNEKIKEKQDKLKHTVTI